MSNTILLIGATGLVGGVFLDLILGDESFENTVVLTRREIPRIEENQRIEQHIVDFGDLDKAKKIIRAKTVVCTLGTTIKKAGTQDNFYEVDFRIPLKIAEMALENGAEKLILISAIGADADSKIFYNKTKGELENAVAGLGYEAVCILRPSLLLGNRAEFRFGEEIGKVLVKPFGFLFPWKYKPVHASTLARKISQLSKKQTKGKTIYEGKQLY
ncbi:MAG: NAD(P)H-binding protein, partial [Proteobacteria bacterium]|nr:NAD(P)H-binding protein [Pseudomonadota bacterium]